LQIAQLDRMLAPDLSGHARNRNRLAAAVECRAVIFDVDTFERSGEPVGIALAPLLTVCNDVEAGAFLVLDRENCCLVLSGFERFRIDQPEIVHPDPRHHLREPRAIDQPIRLRIGANERGRKELGWHRAV
jgi:hypothetical protein